MGLSDLNFIFRFLPAFLLVYFLCPAKYRNAVLFGGSIVFCGFCSLPGAAILLGSVAVNYVLTRILDCRKSPGWRKGWLAAAVLFHVGVLGYFKYMAPSLPPGISFYTFTLLTAAIDVYRRAERPPRSSLELGAFAAMFPKLLSGPITTYHDTIEQVRRRKITAKGVEYGLSLMIVGLAFKVIIADTVGILWHDIRTVGFESISTPLAWMGAAAYSVQLLFDFQGYSLMAVGLGSMLGFRLPRNFDHPYRSLSVSEYYRRWHMSLGRWFRDYLYIPLGGNRRGKLRTQLNKCIVFFCTGLWHGASWNFVLWGLWHGLFIILEGLLPKSGRGRRIWGHVTTLFIVLLGFVLFRADTLADAGLIFSKMFAGSEITLQSSALLRSMLTPYNITVLGLSSVFSLPLLPRVKSFANGAGTVPALLRIGSYGISAALFALCVMNLAGSQFNPFIYFRF